MAGAVQMKLILFSLALSLAAAITACSESKNVTAPSAGAAPGAAAVAIAGAPPRMRRFAPLRSPQALFQRAMAVTC